MRRIKPPSTEEVRALFDYDDTDHTRVLLRMRGAGGRKAGSRAGCIGPRGYAKTSINNTEHRVHRLAWIWHGNALLDDMVIDHINGNPSDNRIGNLQQITYAQNIQKRDYSKTTAKSSSIYYGVQWHPGGRKWMARIRTNGKQSYIGLFSDEKAAAMAYDAAAKVNHGRFARLNFKEQG